MGAYEAGTELTIAIKQGLRWLCAVPGCGFNMSGMTIRDGLIHYYGEHGDEKMKAMASSGFAGIGTPHGTFDDATAGVAKR